MATIALLDDTTLYTVKFEEITEMMHKFTTGDIDYVMSDGLKALANIQNEDDLDILKILVKNSAIKTIDLYNHTHGNPLYKGYIKWEKSWRLDSMESSLSWRNAIESYTNIMSSVNIDDLRTYIYELEYIHCITYDNTTVDLSHIHSLLKEHVLTRRASDCINSLDRPELQTTVIGTKSCT